MVLWNGIAWIVNRIPNSRHQKILTTLHHYIRAIQRKQQKKKHMSMKRFITLIQAGTNKEKTLLNSSYECEWECNGLQMIFYCVEKRWSVTKWTMSLLPINWMRRSIEMIASFAIWSKKAVKWRYFDMFVGKKIITFLISILKIMDVNNIHYDFYMLLHSLSQPFYWRCHYEWTLSLN